MSAINKENAKELGKLGGKKSGEVRRQKRNMRETLELLLSMRIDSGKVDKLEAFKAFHDITKTSNISVGIWRVLEVERPLSSGQRVPCEQEVQDYGAMVHLQSDEVSACQLACGQKDLQDDEGLVLHRPPMGGQASWCGGFLALSKQSS